MKLFKISDKLQGPVITLTLIVSLIALLLFRNILLFIGLYFFCLLFMFKFGAHVVFDLDPVPFSALLLLYVYDHITALIFILLAIPIIDMIVGRLSHFSIINLFAIIATILVFGLLPIKGLVLFYGIIVFNLIRITFTASLRLGLDSVLFSVLHMFLYFVLGALLSFFI